MASPPLSSTLTLTASVSSTSPPPPFSVVNHRFFGLSLLHEYWAVIVICVVLILYFIVISYYKARIYEARALQEPPQIPVQQPKMVKIKASDFTYSEEDREDGSSSECAICLGELEEGNTCRILTKCGHVFHRNCIDQWLKVDMHCPLCRTCVCIVVHAGNTANCTTH